MTTVAQNLHWYQQISNASIPIKVKAISKRLLSDTSLIRKLPGHCRLILPDSPNSIDFVATKAVTDAKPLIILNGVMVNTDDSVCTEKIVKLSELLEAVPFQKIELLLPYEPNTMALYGSAGGGGVVLLTLERKTDIKRFAKHLH